MFSVEDLNKAVDRGLVINPLTPDNTEKIFQAFVTKTFIKDPEELMFLIKADSYLSFMKDRSFKRIFTASVDRQSWSSGMIGIMLGSLVFTDFILASKDQLLKDNVLIKIPLLKTSALLH